VVIETAVSRAASDAVCPSEKFLFRTQVRTEWFGSLTSFLTGDPGLIFLDEPTSGLDAATAQSVVETLCMLASRGRTVICTIHQPRSNIFSKFDRLMVRVQHGTLHSSQDQFLNTGLYSFCPKARLCISAKHKRVSSTFTI
jgi:ABC-type Mn2+/Zn2+ transport system ATPase subunit